MLCGSFLGCSVLTCVKAAPAAANLSSSSLICASDGTPHLIVSPVSNRMRFPLQRFYVGRPISGLVWLFTVGLFGIGWIMCVNIAAAMRRATSSLLFGKSTSHAYLSSRHS